VTPLGGLAPPGHLALGKGNLKPSPHLIFLLPLLVHLAGRPASHNQDADNP